MSPLIYCPDVVLDVDRRKRLGSVSLRANQSIHGCAERCSMDSKLFVNFIHLALGSKVSLLRYISHFVTYSVFGEDALVNVSVEKKDDNGKLAGYIRIRSKTQGIALSLGDRITSVQRADQMKQ